LFFFCVLQKFVFAYFFSLFGFKLFLVGTVKEKDSARWCVLEQIFF